MFACGKSHKYSIDKNGNEILLHNQTNYQEASTPITHWGGDTRTIYTIVKKNETTGLHYTSGYNNWAGID